MNKEIIDTRTLEVTCCSDARPSKWKGATKRQKPISSYSERLRDPRWQKKRLEIMQRDGFSCKFCGDNETELHVHHRRYINGNEPWEYDNSELDTLCKTCHSYIEGIKTRISAQSFVKHSVCGVYCEATHLIEKGHSYDLAHLLSALKRHPYLIKPFLDTATAVALGKVDE